MALFFLFACERDNGGGMADYAGSFPTLELAWAEYKQVGRDWADLAVFDNGELVLFAKSDEVVTYLKNGHRRVERGWRTITEDKFIRMENREQRQVIMPKPQPVSTSDPGGFARSVYVTGLVMHQWKDV